MKLFVTGGLGFIGGNFVNFWLKHHPKDHVVVYDKMTYAASRHRVPQSHPGLKVVRGDVCDYQKAKAAMAGCDMVVHFAAETHVDRSLAGLQAERLFLASNADGTQTMLHAAQDAGVKHFHHVSTDEVFGDLEFNDTKLFDEDFPYNPHNPYSISKATSDFIVRSFGKTHGMPYTISNCTNNYGPYQTPEKMIPRSILLLASGKKVQLYTDQNGQPGKNIRDWLHVEDHCEAIEKIILHGKPGETYCVGGKNEIRNHDLVKILLEHVSKIVGKELTFEKDVEFVKDRPGHDKRYAMDISKIKKELSWSPKVNFEQGMEKTVKWYLSKEGRDWLATLESTSQDVREGQGRKASK